MMIASCLFSSTTHTVKTTSQCMMTAKGCVWFQQQPAHMAQISSLSRKHLGSHSASSDIMKLWSFASLDVVTYISERYLMCFIGSQINWAFFCWQCNSSSLINMYLQVLRQSFQRNSEDSFLFIHPSLETSHKVNCSYPRSLARPHTLNSSIPMLS